MSGDKEPIVCQGIRLLQMCQQIRVIVCQRYGHCVKRYATVSGEMRYFHGTNVSEDKGTMVYQATMTNSMSGEKGPTICEGTIVCQGIRKH